MPVRVTAGLINGHLTGFIRREEHVTGAGGANRIDGDARVAIRSVLKADRAGERGGHFTMDLTFGGARANSSPTD